MRVVNAATGAVLYDQNRLFTGNSLVAGATVDRSVQFTLPDGPAGQGTFNVTVRVDAGSSITEFNADGTGETNNTTTSTFTSTLASYPDLSVINIDVPSTVRLGEATPIQWTVRNSGTGDLTRSTRDRVYLSTDDRLDGLDRI